MEDLVPLIAGVLVTVLLAPGALRAFEANGWTRPNHRGRPLAFPAGAIAVAASLVALGVVAVLERLGAWDGPYGSLLALALGVAFLGLLDDLLEAPGRGWRGHARAMLRGGFSTGALKAVGTLCLAVATVPRAPAAELAVSVALVALTTNLFNLLDLRPGRAVKAFALLGAALVASTGTEMLRAVGLFAGPLLVLGLYDLRERAMLGDTGSNLFGALAGIWLVAALGLGGELAALAVVLALTVYGELRSLSAAVERIGVLRWLDGLGRPRDGRAARPAAPSAHVADER